MFGTLQIYPSESGPVFVEKADGAAYRARAHHVPHHTACDQCRQRKLRCTGGKPRCSRCATNSNDCSYGTIALSKTQRRRESKRLATRNGLRRPRLATPNRPDSSSITQTVSAGIRHTSIDEGENIISVPLLDSFSCAPETRNVSNSSIPGATEGFSFLDFDPNTTVASDSAFHLLPDLESPFSTFRWSPQDDVTIHSPPVTTTTHVASTSSSKCTKRCVKDLVTLLEEIEACMHDMGPCKADVALAFQKRAHSQCSQVVLCNGCYVDSDAMMILTMICDKMIMLNKKILWYTKEDSVVEKPLSMGEYEMDQLDEWGGMVQLLTAVQLRKVKRLVDDIEASPAIEGKHAQLIVLRSVKQQVVSLLGRIKVALSEAVLET